MRNGSMRISIRKREMEDEQAELFMLYTFGFIPMIQCVIQNERETKLVHTTSFS